MSVKIGESDINIDGEIIPIDESNSVPYVENGRTMMPVRGLAEAIGADVSFDAEEQTVTVETPEAIVAGNKPIINKKKVLPPIELDEDDDSTRGMFGEREEKKEIEPPVVGEPKKQKNKYLALLLAFIPFNLFGIYQFYMNGKKKGLKRLCTLNFVYVGYFMDWYDAVKNFLNSNNN